MRVAQKHRMVLLAAAGAIVGAVAVAAVAVPADDGDNSAKSMVVGEAKGRFPTSSDQDLVTYADRLVAIEIRSEREEALSGVTAGEGMIDRVVTIELGKTFWSREGAPLAPQSFELGVPGWTVHDGKRTEFAIKGAPRFEVGNTYLALLTRLANGRWVPLGGDTVFPYNDKKFNRGEQKGGIKKGSIRERMQGKSVDDLVELLESTSPYAEAEGLAPSDPEQRARKVAEKRRPPEMK